MAINFEKFSLEELESSLKGIDKERYPENYNRLLHTLERKRQEAQSPPTSASVPKGFKSHLQDDGSIIIEYSEEYRIGVAIFLAFWLSGWTVGGIMAFSKIQESWFIKFWLIGWAFGEYFAAKQLLSMLFGKLSISLAEGRMVVKKSFFRWDKVYAIEREAIKRIFQLQDRKKDADNEPAWGLKVAALADHYLLKYQEYEKSEWLGEVLGKWAGVPFEKVEKRS